MSSDDIQVDYEQLESLATQLQNQSDVVQGIIQKVNNGIYTLQAGGWQGRDANQFYGEYDDIVRLALGRLQQALVTAGEHMRHISSLFQQAEEDAAAMVRNDGNGGGGSGEKAGQQAVDQLDADQGTRQDAGNKYTQTIDKFNVAQNAKYQRNRQGRGETYCNIFAADVAREMGAPLPEWLDFNKDGVVDDWLNANEMVQWLDGSYSRGSAQTGQDLGWQTVDAATAAQMANDGHVVVAGWNNPGGIGHMAVVRPGSSSGNIQIAQAGSQNFNEGSLAQGFGTGRNVQFFVYPAD